MLEWTTHKVKIQVLGEPGELVVFRLWDPVTREVRGTAYRMPEQVKRALPWCADVRGGMGWENRRLGAFETEEAAKSWVERGGK